MLLIFNFSVKENDGLIPSKYQGQAVEYNSGRTGTYMSHFKVDWTFKNIPCGISYK